MPSVGTVLLVFAMMSWFTLLAQAADLPQDIDPDLPKLEDIRISRNNKDTRLNEQLAMLKSELSDEKLQGREVCNDKLHTDNLEHRRDKYKTLRQIRAGNTKQRVDEFKSK